MRALHILVGVAGAVLIATVATSRSDTATSEESTAPVSASAEPTAGSVVMPQPGSERPAKSPFVPYATGQEAEPSTLWSREALSPAEQAQADRDKGHDYTAINNAFAAASAQQADQARAAAAATQLGTSNLATTGVVP
jgi:hypothetical protein